jgi:hypothetical protein
MPTAAGQHAKDIFERVLLGRAVSLDDAQKLVDLREPEGLSLEYKRGSWTTKSDDTLTHEFRRYTAGFANAEGGLLVVGVVGGEDAQGDAKWSIEGATCRDLAGWNAWLGKVLQEIAVRTRVRWTVLKANDGNEIVFIAVDRAEALVQFLERRRRFCYLRIGEQTIAMDDTLYTDLVLGRRAKPDLELAPPEVSVIRDSRGRLMKILLAVHNQGLVWVPDLKVALVGYSHGRISTSASIRRQLDVRPADPADAGGSQLHLTTAGDDDWNQAIPDRGINSWRCRRELKDRGLSPFATIELSAEIVGFPGRESDVGWIWCGAILVVPMNGIPLWAQVGAHGRGDFESHAKGWIPEKGRPPIVAWVCGEDALGGVDRYISRDPRT